MPENHNEIKKQKKKSKTNRKIIKEKSKKRHPRRAYRLIGGAKGENRTRARNQPRAKRDAHRRFKLQANRE